MRYTVAELDAMPVGTVLASDGLCGCGCDEQPLYRKRLARNGVAFWAEYNRGLAVSDSWASSRNFTHRADPVSIAPVQGSEGATDAQ